MTNELVNVLNDCLKKNPEFSKLLATRMKVSSQFADETKIVCGEDTLNEECYITPLGLINTVLELAGHPKVVSDFETVSHEEIINEFRVMESPELEDLRAQVDKRMKDPDYNIVTNYAVKWEDIEKLTEEKNEK